jgi:hypothetical protein
VDLFSLERISMCSVAIELNLTTYVGCNNTYFLIFNYYKIGSNIVMVVIITMAAVMVTMIH